MWKIAVFVLSVSIFQISLCDAKVPKNTANDADDALNEFIQFSMDLIEDINAEVEDYAGKRIAQFLELQNDTFQFINNKLDDIKAKIQQIETNVQETNINNEITSCATGFDNQIENFRTQQTRRIIECTTLSSSIIMNILKNQTQSELAWQHSGYVTCNNRTRFQCENYGTDDSCFDSFIDNLKEAKERIEASYQITKTNMLNKILSFTLPCQDLINFEMSVYPEYILKTITECVETDLRNSRPYTCPL